jgi:hypothetical protein
VPTFCTEDDVRNVDLVGVFEKLTEGQINNAIDCAELYIGEDAWNEDAPGRATKGCAYLAAFFLKDGLEGGDAAAGPVTGESAGGLSISFQGLSGKLSESAFAANSFGRMYLELRRLVPSTPLVLC